MRLLSSLKKKVAARGVGKSLTANLNFVNQDINLFFYPPRAAKLAAMKVATPTF